MQINRVDAKAGEIKIFNITIKLKLITRITYLTITFF